MSPAPGQLLAATSPAATPERSSLSQTAIALCQQRLTELAAKQPDAAAPAGGGSGSAAAVDSAINGKKPVAATADGGGRDAETAGGDGAASHANSAEVKEAEALRDSLDGLQVRLLASCTAQSACSPRPCVRRWTFLWAVSRLGFSLAAGPRLRTPAVCPAAGGLQPGLQYEVPEFVRLSFLSHARATGPAWTLEEAVQRQKARSWIHAYQLHAGAAHGAPRDPGGGRGDKTAAEGTLSFPTNPSSMVYPRCYAAVPLVS